MAGNKLGGKKAAQKNKELYGEDFYRKIGARGGQNSNTGGFAADRKRASEAGRKGGLVSRRGKNRVKRIPVIEG